MNLKIPTNEIDAGAVKVLEYRGFMDNIEKRIKEIMCDCFDLEMDQLVDNAHLVDDLGVDSISVVEMIVTLEEEYGIEIHDKDTSNYLTVKDAIASIKKLIEGK